MKRTFIAIKIPLTDTLKNKYESIKELLWGDSVKWVNEHQLHLTLFFLGDTDEVKIKRINEKLIDIAGNINRTFIEISGPGVFQSIKNPKVLWLGINITNEIMELQSLISETLKESGFSPDNKQFKPHLTIGRIKNINNKNKLKQMIDNEDKIVIERIPVNGFTFYESILTPKGPVYKILNTYSLK